MPDSLAPPTDPIPSVEPTIPTEVVVALTPTEPPAAAAQPAVKRLLRRSTILRLINEALADAGSRHRVPTRNTRKRDVAIALRALARR